MTNVDPPSSSQPCQSEAFYRQLCEHAGVVLIGVDRTLKIRTWNRSAASLFGTSKEGVLGTDILSVLPAQHRGEAQTLLRASIDGPDVSHLDFTMRDQHGEPRELICTFAPILDDENRCLGASVSIRDISSHLAKLSSQHQSKKMTALAELAGHISHHFNNVLGGVITSLDFAASSGDLEMMSRITKQVSETLYRATSLVKGLKTFAEGYPDVGNTAQLTDIIKSLVAELSESADLSGVIIRIIPDVSSSIQVPQEQTEAILRSIMENAIDAMPQGGNLDIGTSKISEGVAISISDTGIGLDREGLSRAFEPFWSSGPKKSQMPRVSGLGLAIAYGIARVCGASIDISSSPGEGAKFIVSIPC